VNSLAIGIQGPADRIADPYYPGCVPASERYFRLLGIHGPIISSPTRSHRGLSAGLTGGPIYAELRVDSRGVLARSAMFELAARSVGGLCPRALRFPGGKTLEELVLGNALGRPAPAPGDEPAWPSGVFMLPVPRPGVLRTVHGRDRAAAVPGITGLTITIPSARRSSRSRTGRSLSFISPKPIPGTTSRRRSPPPATGCA